MLFKPLIDKQLEPDRFFVTTRMSDSNMSSLFWLLHHGLILRVQI
jgi:hypothetical protein